MPTSSPRASSSASAPCAEGLHKVLDFDGVIMTDSGSFQLSVYGQVSITNTETLSFQRDIRSDIWVPLDIPTSPASDRATTEQELAITMQRLKEAKEVFGTDAPLAGPVQGGIFEDLRERAGREVTDLGFSFCPIGAVVPLMESYRYRDLVSVVMAAKRTLSPSACVHLFGAGHPSMFALATAMGCDLFDSAAYALYAKDGRYLTIHGSFRIEELIDLPCACAVCRTHTAEELRSAPDRERLLALHNLHVTLAEIARIRQAIFDGTLWELVDERCRGHPQLLSGYRALLDHSARTGRHDRVSKRRFFYRGDESCRRTEVLRYQQQLAQIRSGRTSLLHSMAGNGTNSRQPSSSSPRSARTSEGTQGDLPHRALRDPGMGRCHGPAGMQGHPDPAGEPSGKQVYHLLQPALGYRSSGKYWEISR